MGLVAYKLELPVEDKVHLVFHMSQLKLHVGFLVTHIQLPLLTKKEVLAKEPVAILDQRIGKKNGKEVTELFI